MKRAELEFMQKWLGWLGPDHPQRAQAIDALFEQRTATIWSTCYADISTIRQETAMDRARRTSGAAAVIIAASRKNDRRQTRSGDPKAPGTASAATAAAAVSSARSEPHPVTAPSPAGQQQ
jgi:hypothetical protein